MLRISLNGERLESLIFGLGFICVEVKKAVCCRPLEQATKQLSDVPLDGGKKERMTTRLNSGVL